MALASRILLPTMLLALTAPLGAKCPSNLVEVHGKIECAITSDSKVVVSLVYSGKQKEGTGEENTLAVQGDTFKGQVAFSTFSSNSFLRGDHCGSKPTGAVVRLIAGDGTERDRKKLKVVDDFRYDEAKWTFTVQSDVILRGWCDSKCPDRQSKPCANPK